MIPRGEKCERNRPPRTFGVKRICNQLAGIVIARRRAARNSGNFSANRPGIALAILSHAMVRHSSSRIVLIFLTSLASVVRLHAHTVTEPAAVTQELNRCLMMVRVAATRRTSSPQKADARPTPSKARGRYDDYQVPAGTPLVVRLRTAMDSASGQLDDPIRATLLSSVTQDGNELIPKGSTVHGKVTDVQAASKENRTGRIVVEFNVIEHAETRSLATIQTRAVPFEAMLGPKEKFRDVRVESGEQLTLTLATPLKVRLPRAQ